jgi:hypothetical protein
VGPTASVFYLLLVSYWLNVLLFLVSSGAGKFIKGILNISAANVTLSAFQWLKEKPPLLTLSNGYTTCLLITPRVIPTTVGDQQVEIIR